MPKARGLASWLLLSAWCGLFTGFLEVATTLVRKQFFDANHLLGKSSHFIWIVPSVDLVLFLIIGLLGATAVILIPRSGPWLLDRALCAIGLLPFFTIAFSRIFATASLILAIGIATRLVPLLERHEKRFRQFVRLTFPLGLATLAILAVSPAIHDRLDQSREDATPMPPPNSPNLVLIILDTVAASHLELHGYARPTSTTLSELAESGIQFSHAQAASSWTLPSHATIFTGRWLHELSVGWLNPLDATHPTLAGYLRDHGYATAGFIANTVYCARDSGLNRGFTHYEDYIFPQLTALKSANLVNRLLATIQSVVNLVEDQPALATFHSSAQRFWKPFVADRKRASVLNKQFLAWLAHRGQPERPFFAFLNYFDAHTPYDLPAGRIHRFGVARPDGRQNALIRLWADLDKARLSPPDVAIAADAYDDCVADLDEQLGKLIDELRRRHVLDHTWLIIASDHGESFGEHPDVFCHGTSLFQTELHVPLVIIPPNAHNPNDAHNPNSHPLPRVVNQTVSLRDLPATVVDLLGLSTGSPLPGSSLTHYWKEPTNAPRPNTRSHDPHPALAELVPGDSRHRDLYGLPLKTSPIAASNDGVWSYIHEANNVEWLYHAPTDAAQSRNLSRDPASQTILNQLRQTLDRLTDGPLLPERFNR